MRREKAVVIPFPRARQFRRRIDLALALALLSKAVKAREMTAWRAVARAHSLELLLRASARRMEHAKPLGA